MTVDSTNTEEVGRALLVHLGKERGRVDLRFSRAPRRIFGGNQSFVYALEIDGDADLSGPLILRILRPFLHAESVSREAAVQDALAMQGYPVARVLYRCERRDVLGGPFQLMSRLAGAPMLHADTDSQGTISLRDTLRDFGGFVFGPWPELLAGLQQRLHTLSRETLLRDLTAAGLDPQELSLDVVLQQLVLRCTQVDMESLAEVFEWMRRRADFVPEDCVLCHGDFFPNQILVDGGRVEGVIDWSDACFAPPEYDAVVVKVGIETLPVPLGPLGRRIVAGRAGRFFDAYRSRQELDPTRFSYFAALRCAQSLLGVAERRQALGDAASGAANPNPYDHPSAVAGFLRRVTDETGIRVSLG